MAKQDDRFLSESSSPSNTAGAEWKGFKTTEAHFVRPEEIPNQSCYLKEFRDEMTKRIGKLPEAPKKDRDNDKKPTVVMEEGIQDTCNDIFPLLNKFIEEDKKNPEDQSFSELMKKLSHPTATPTSSSSSSSPPAIILPTYYPESEISKFLHNSTPDALYSYDKPSKYTLDQVAFVAGNKKNNTLTDANRAQTARYAK